MDEPADEISGAVSDLADLRRVPLAQLQPLSNATVDLALRRILRNAPQPQQVPVAAFNSSI